MTSVNIPGILVKAAAGIGLHASAAKLTNVCDAKTAAVYAAANVATQIVYGIYTHPASRIAITICGSQFAGYLGGNIATLGLCQREITVKEACILTGVSTIQGAVIGAIAGAIVGALQTMNQ